MKTVAVLLCAGASTRMGFQKLLLTLPGGTPIALSMAALVKGGAQALVLVVNPDTRDAAISAAKALGVPYALAQGGETRQKSVLNGLHGVGDDCEIVIIHDAARCLVSPDIVRRSIESAKRTGSGVAAINMQDTVVARAGDESTPLDRETLLCTQTPQTFRYPDILLAYRWAEETGVDATDDGSLLLKMGKPVSYIAGSPRNRKLTVPEDAAFFQAVLGDNEKAPAWGRMAVGWGEDVHRLVEGRKLILGGVEIPFEKGLLGHSDADVLVHAIIDALLGAAAAGDIGRMFPDTDAAYKDIGSATLLRRVMERLSGCVVEHVDATIVAQRPRLAPYLPQMEQLLRPILGISAGQLNIKATTTEGAGPEGRGETIRATAVALLRKG